MTEESPTVPLDRYTTEYFRSAEDDDVNGYVNGSNT